jgi:hypothetical protein
LVALHLASPVIIIRGLVDCNSILTKGFTLLSVALKTLSCLRQCENFDRVVLESASKPVLRTLSSEFCEMFPFDSQKILSPAQLKRLSEHKYSCASDSLLDPVLQPYWNKLTSCLPLWLAPNLITVAGLIVNILTTLVLVWYCPDAKAEVKSTSRKTLIYDSS